jgi:hypothetical protein
MRVTSVINLLGAELLKKQVLFYLETIGDSSILFTTIALYEAWNKPKKAEEWQAKFPQTETVTE